MLNILRDNSNLNYAKTTKTKKKVTKTEITKYCNKIKVVKPPIKISKTYVPKDTEKYMCEKHKVFFRINYRVEKRISKSK